MTICNNNDFFFSQKCPVILKIYDVTVKIIIKHFQEEKCFPELLLRNRIGRQRL